MIETATCFLEFIDPPKRLRRWITTFLALVAEQFFGTLAIVRAERRSFRAFVANFFSLWIVPFEMGMLNQENEEIPKLCSTSGWHDNILWLAA